MARFLAYTTAIWRGGLRWGGDEGTALIGNLELEGDASGNLELEGDAAGNLELEGAG